MFRIKSLAIAIMAMLLIGLMGGATLGHGTCANHSYRTYDGTHDGDGDGVGCESLPARPRLSSSVSYSVSSPVVAPPADDTPTDVPAEGGTQSDTVVIDNICQTDHWGKERYLDNCVLDSDWVLGYYLYILHERSALPQFPWLDDHDEVPQPLSIGWSRPTMGDIWAILYPPSS